MKHISDKDLQECVKTKNFDNVAQFPPFPCHTQGTEQCIWLVTQASAAVCGEAARDVFIRVKLQSCAIMKKFD